MLKTVKFNILGPEEDEQEKQRISGVTMKACLRTMRKTNLKSQNSTWNEVASGCHVDSPSMEGPSDVQNFLSANSGRSICPCPYLWLQISHLFPQSLEEVAVNDTTNLAS